MILDRTAIAHGLISGLCCALALIVANPDDAVAVELPVPSTTFVTGGTPWVTAGQASLTVVGNVMDIHAGTDKQPNVTLNWKSFGIGPEGTVNFIQPAPDAIALNKILGADPTLILGHLNANGQVYLLNPNGIVFGRGSQVNVRGLIASTLNITPEAEALGLTAAINTAQPAFAAVLGSGKVLNKDLVVEQGAAIVTPSGGRVLLFGPNVSNEGNITTPDGQVALAAGQKIYLTTDNSGLVVEVSAGGTVTNGASNQSTAPAGTGQIIADHGSVSLVGLAVNQLGRISASTAVRQGGSIVLKARNSSASGGGAGTSAAGGGAVTFGVGSVTSASPDVSDTATTLDANPQPQGVVTALGKTITLQSGSEIDARGGAIALIASQLGGEDANPIGTADASRIRIAAGASIDASGTAASLPADRNVLTVKLQGDELKDRPVQRGGSLYRQVVTVDLRQHGRLDDGTEWVGTPLADLRNAAAGVPRTVAERSSAGGSVNIQSAGDVILAPGSTIDVAGGAIQYAAGQVQTTQLIRNDQIVDIGSANQNLVYDGIIGPVNVEHHKWGQTETFQVAGIASATGSAAYVDGRDAGSVTIASPKAIIEGNLLGGTRPGEFQRQPSDLSVQRGGIRGFDELPLQGQLTLGIDRSASVTGIPDFVTRDVTIDRTDVLSALSGFTVTTDPFPASVKSVFLSPDALGHNGMTDIHVFSDGRITVPTATAIDLGVGGNLQLVGAEVLVQGQVLAAGGKIAITSRSTAGVPGETLTGQTRVADTALLDVSGRWINDSSLTNADGSVLVAPSVINAGSITIDGNGLRVDAGSRLYADGGAQLTSGNKLIAGAGGVIALSAHRTGSGVATVAILDGDLRAQSLTNGGTLSLLASDICIIAIDCGAPRIGLLQIVPGRFLSGGFSGFNLTAEGGGLSVATGTTVQLQQQNYILSDSAPTIASTKSLSSLATTGLLRDFDRRPVSLSLTTTLVPNTAASRLFNNDQLSQAALLRIGAQSQILAEAGASIALLSNSRMYVDGEISAPAGNISLSLGAGNVSIDAGSRFSSRQTLWLGPDARLLAGGSVKLQPNEAGLRLGTVLNAGSISLKASSGYIVTEAGSMLDVSASDALLDIVPPGEGVVAATRQQIAGAAGSIALRAAEGILFNGEMRATGLDDGMAGSLTVTLDAQGRADTGDQQVAATFGLPTGSRTIVVSGQEHPTVVRVGDPIPATLNGLALFNTAQLQRGGFGDIRLQARNLARPVTGEQIPGTIRLTEGASLTASRSVSVIAAGIASDGTPASISAPYLVMGNDDDAVDKAGLRALPGLQSGTGRLTLTANTIDLVGQSRLLGFGATEFRSSEDIRLRGLQIQGQPQILGSLETTGDLAFAARQIYPTTLSDFTLGVRNSTFGQISVSSTGADVPALSAGGSITLQAPFIRQGGTVKAPMGSITFDAASRIDLLPGSLTSTSLEGRVVPFGRVELGTDWLYSLDKNSVTRRLVFNTAGARAADEFPEQRVVLTAPGVRIGTGAVVDESGGGDLLAYEFKPGLSGTVDVLNPALANGAFAIVPTLGASFATIDPQEYAGFTIKAGSSVELANGVPGLPAGRYAVLPPRYALLPGAFLVKKVAGFTDLEAGQSFTPGGGGTLISGREVFAVGQQGASRTQGYLVRASNELGQLASYDLYRANQSGALFEHSRLPRDGGVLQVSAASTLELGGLLKSVPGINGRGAAAEFTGNRLQIVNGTAGSAAASGVLLIDAQGLNALGAESLVLGGTMARTDTGIALNVTATSVDVDTGVSLAAPELILAARDRIDVQTGARITGQGTGSGFADDLLLSGEGALLRVSANPQIELTRSAVPATPLKGSITIGQGAVVTASASMLLDSTLDTRLGGTLSQRGGAVTLSSSKISLGAPAGAVNGLQLSQSDLAALAVDDLSLRSRSGIDVYGSVSAVFKNLALDTPQIVGLGAAGNVAHFDTQRFALTNSFGAASLVPASGSGRMEVASGKFEVGDGNIAISGFATTALASTGDFLATSTTGGTLRVGGDLDITSARVTGNKGASLSIVSSGALRSLAGGSSLTPTTALGVRLALTGSSLLQSGSIVAPSGTVTLAATGVNAADGVTLGAGALVDVGGIGLRFADQSIDAPAGDIVLTAAAGGIAIDSGATVNISGAGNGTAGTVTAQASQGALVVNGLLHAGAATDDSSGRVHIDVGHLDNFTALNAALNSGQFRAERQIRTRSGDINVAATSQIQAERVKLVADQGAINVDGGIGSGADKGASIELDARNDVSLRNGARLDASVHGVGNEGGRIALNSTDGGVLIQSGATIDVAPAVATGEVALDAYTQRGGQVDLRVPNSVALTVADASAANDRMSLAGAIHGARQVNLIAYQSYADADGHVSANEMLANGSNPRFANAQAFIQANGAAIRTGLGIAAGDTRFSLRPGIAITTARGQDLTLDSDWDLSTWRFANAVGELTLRSGGNLLFNASLSDGFAGVADLNDTVSMPTLLQGDSWSYRLAAGADAQSADTLATTAGSGSLVLGAGVPDVSDFFSVVRPQSRAIRTGTGQIDIAAGSDVVLSNRASVIYTAGKDSKRGIALGTPGETGTLEGRAYPTAGGDIHVQARGSVRGIATDMEGDFNNYSNQLINSWLYRQGNEATIFSGDQATGWTIAYEWFEQGIGALGGGNVSVLAGKDVDNLSVSIPTIGRQTGGTTRVTSQVEVDGGGDLSVVAGGDIRSGVFLVSKGSGTLQAGGGIVSGRTLVAGDDTPLDTILAVENGRFSLRAHDDIELDAVVDPMLLPQSLQQRPLGSFSAHSFFNTYADSAGVSLTSVVGDATLHNGLVDVVDPSSTRNPFALGFDASSGAENAALQLFAPVLQARALQGDLTVERRFVLYPSAQGDLQLLAGNNVLFKDKLSLSDADTSLLPSVASPSSVFLPLQTLTDGNTFAPKPLHASASATSVPARIIAQGGDITYQGPDNDPIFLSKPALLDAGRDITGLSVLIQNTSNTDLSIVHAGRDISYPFARNPNGSFQSGLNSIQVQGPGRLSVEAGRSVELGVSSGIVSLGNTKNPALGNDGANISVSAGLGSGPPAYTAFAAKYLPDAYRSAVIAIVRSKPGNAGLTDGAAMAAFQALPSDEQQAGIYHALSDKIYDALANELTKTGRANAALDVDKRDYSRGDTAIKTLFPNASYAGDINLFFSRIYTLDGGNIDLMAPGGLINVGLSTPPSGFGIRKAASQLGVVAQSAGSVRAFLKGDFAVNESRVFAADGGDILVWSSDGDIDAGRGAKTSIAAPPPTVTVDPATGVVSVSFPPALTGSGIRTLTSTPGRAFGSVDLITPHGVVNASEAGIESQGNVTISATRVLGVDNIKVGGVATGVPVDTGGLGAGLTGVSSVASSASNAATEGIVNASQEKGSEVPLAQSALSWLEVFVMSLGEEDCRPDDLECLKRQHK